MAVVTLAVGAGPSTVLPSQLPADRGQLATELDSAQQIIDSASSSAAQLKSAGRFEQLATAALAGKPRRYERATVAMLSDAAARAIGADLAAAGVLHRLVTPRPALPPWKIVSPPPASTLLGYFRQAGSRFKVPWQYLAAIEFIETKFGRVVGLSTAGAEGPMQFLPSTWAIYGRGDVHSPRAAVFGAARFLGSNGAPADIAGALYHYNPSPDYVHAVEDYAALIRADPRAYYGYYYWRVIYAERGGAVILPAGFPRARAIRLGPLLGGWG
jgi:hypothetical protein